MRRNRITIINFINYLMKYITVEVIKVERLYILKGSDDGV
jgi:hypothetical protein